MHRGPARHRRPVNCSSTIFLQAHKTWPGGPGAAPPAIRHPTGSNHGACQANTRRGRARGASSDAAAALIAGNLAWGLNWPIDRLQDVAAELGSDVPFFLKRGAALARGRGEQLEAIRSSRLNVVLIRPPLGLSTPQVYQHCQPKQGHVGATGLFAALARGNASMVGRQLCNDLQTAAAKLTPWIATLKSEFKKQHVLGHQMSGSGSSYFGLCRSRRHAPALLPG